MKNIKGKIDSVPVKNDYQIVLNTVLGIYYELKVNVYLEMVAKKIEIPFSKHDLYTAFDSLIEDGYIKHPKAEEPTFNKLRVAKITGKGRLFFEAGGYRDEKSQFDKIVDWSKNNKIVAYCLVGFIVIAGLKEIYDIVVELIKIGK